jgi:hypothetical protein
MRLALRSRRLWFFLAVVVLLLLLGLVIIQGSTLTIHWVGFTDLEIEFFVMDAVTGQPIKGATIQVLTEDCLCAAEDKQFSLTTDHNGSLRHLTMDCMCFGTSGPTIDTYVVHLPSWTYQVKAAGYVSTEWTSLDVPENIRQLKRAKPAARLVVRVALKAA